MISNVLLNAVQRIDRAVIVSEGLRNVRTVDIKAKYGKRGAPKMNFVCPITEKIVSDIECFCCQPYCVGRLRLKEPPR